ncbi:hypothetical protein Tco_1366069, partial [Tanacetum coccineum]
NVSVDEKGDSGKKEVNAGRKSFVEVISGSLSANDRSLECIPTKINDNEVKVVVFDDIMAVEGSKRWELTLCGFFWTLDGEKETFGGSEMECGSKAGKY